MPDQRAVKRCLAALHLLLASVQPLTRLKRKWPSMLFIVRCAAPPLPLHASCSGGLRVIRIHWAPPKCHAGRLSWHMLAEAAAYWNRLGWFCNVKWRPFQAVQYKTCTPTARTHAGFDLQNLEANILMDLALYLRYMQFYASASPCLSKKVLRTVSCK